ncbi:hypothetical protein H0H87_002249, partial [Tephrocybe sp. NHM501043]
MAGKTLEESKKARQAFFKEKRDGKRDGKQQKKLTITPNGSSFVVEGDPESVALYLASQKNFTSTNTTIKSEFAGLAADPTPTAYVLSEEESLEIDAWIIEDTEPKTT